LRAIEKYQPESFLLAGGVSANNRLREKLQKSIPVNLYLPKLEFTTDNAAMIASAAFFQNNPVPWQEVNANPELSITD
jgi:N6-L-threonylcarbamoyladenine synthase